MSQTAYFNLPGIGELYHDETLFKFNETPVDFICLDKSNRMYFAICNEEETELSWVITEVSYDDISKLIKRQWPLLNVFKNSNRIISVIKQDGRTTVSFHTYESIDKDELPDKSAYEDLTYEKKVYLLARYYSLSVPSGDVKGPFSA